jgi:creatinine amidohydrolase
VSRFLDSSLRHASQTSAEAGAGTLRAVLIPVGAVEQHGPHLPLGVDIWLATAVAAAVAATEPEVRVAEPLGYGISPHHLGFPGTVTLRSSTFLALMTDVCAGFAAQSLLPILVNGHGGNRGALQVVVSDLGAAGITAAALTYFDLIAEEAKTILPDVAQGTGHACALETALMMHVLPDTVRRDHIPPGGTPEVWPDPHLYAPGGVTVWRPFEAINPTGVIGIPSDATPERGAALFAAVVAATRRAVRALVAHHAPRPSL